MEKIIRKEALELSRKICRIVPAELGNSIGDYAAVAAACGGIS
jgi:glucokinase